MTTATDLPTCTRTVPLSEFGRTLRDMRDEAGSIDEMIARWLCFGLIPPVRQPLQVFTAMLSQRVPLRDKLTARFAKPQNLLAVLSAEQSPLASWLVNGDPELERYSPFAVIVHELFNFVQAPGKYRGLFWAGSSQHQPLPWIATHANEPLEKISISHRIPTLARFVEGNPAAVVAIQGGQLFVGDAAAMSELIGSGTGWVASRKHPLGPMDGGITWMSDGRHGVIRLMNSGGIWADADMRHVSIRNPDGFSVLNTGIDHAMTVARSAIGPQDTVVREVKSPRRGLVSLEFTPSPKVEA